MKKNEAAEAIYNLVSYKLMNYGFKPSKDRCKWSRNNKIHKEEILILLTQRGDAVSQHIKIVFTDKIVSKEMNRLEELVREKENLKPLNIMRATCEITDWKELYDGIDNSIWLDQFSTLSEINNKENDYLELIEIAVDWLEKIKKPEEMKKNLLASGMTLSLVTYLIIDKLNKATLNSSYEYIINKMSGKKCWDKSELDAFYVFLCQDTP